VRTTDNRFFYFTLCIIIYTLVYFNIHAASASKTPTPDRIIVQFVAPTDLKAKTVEPKINTSIAQYFFIVTIKYSADKLKAFIFGECESKYKPLIETQATKNPSIQITAVYYKPTPTVTRTP
jgi:hypothetical protein